MSLDFSLIERSTRYSLQKLSLIGTATEKLYLLEDFLHPELVSKLTEYVQTATGWHPAQGYKETFRYQTNWEPDSVVEETHLVFDSLTEQLQSVFASPVHFHGINLWKDTEGYSIARHTDNPVIDIAIQLYLTSGPAELGTVFEYGPGVRAKYQANCGYLATAGLYHRLDTRVPADHTRYSVYAIWSLQTKK